MTSKRMAWIFFAGTIVAAGCDGPTGLGTGGGGASSTSGATGGAGGTSSSSSSTSSSSSSTSSSSSGTGGSKPLDPSGYSCSGATPSLSNDVVPITMASCSSKNCHLAMQSAPGVYDQLVNRIAEQCLDSRLMVDPGNPEKSYAIHKLTNHNICTGQTMPKDAPLLDDAKIQIIYDWICSGAPNN